MRTTSLDLKQHGKWLTELVDHIMTAPHLSEPQREFLLDKLERDIRSVCDFCDQMLVERFGRTFRETLQ